MNTTTVFHYLVAASILLTVLSLTLFGLTQPNLPEALACSLIAWIATVVYGLTQTNEIFV